jgi:hypothetical protein
MPANLMKAIYVHSVEKVVSSRARQPTAAHGGKKDVHIAYHSNNKSQSISLLIRYAKD